MKSKYKCAKLKDYITEIKRKNKSNEEIEVFSVTNKLGFINSKNYFAKEVFSKDTSTYNVVIKGEFAYNPSRIDVGSIDYLKNHEKVLVSPLYNVFKVNKGLIPEYLLLYLKNEYGISQIKLNENGAVRHNLKFSGLQNIIIPIPDIDDQVRVVSLLSRIQMIIEKRNNTISLLDKLSKNVFYTMFGDPVKNEKGYNLKKLMSLGEINSGGTPPLDSVHKFNDCDERIDWYKAGDLNSLFLSSSNETMPKRLLEENLIKVFNRGSLLIGMYDTAAFKLGILENDSSANQACANIETNINANVIWLYYELLLMRNYFLKFRRGGRQKNLTLNMIRNFEVPVPNKELQDKFSKIALEIESMKKKHERNLTELNNLYGAITIRAFKGEIDLYKFEKIVDKSLDEINYIEENSILNNNSLDLERVIKSFKQEFTFIELWEKLNQVEYVEKINYDNMKNEVFKMIECNNGILEQCFSKEKETIVLRVK